MEEHVQRLILVHAHHRTMDHIVKFQFVHRHVRILVTVLLQVFVRVILVGPAVNAKQVSCRQTRVSFLSALTNFHFSENCIMDV